MLECFNVIKCVSADLLTMPCSSVWRTKNNYNQHIIICTCIIFVKVVIFLESYVWKHRHVTYKLLLREIWCFNGSHFQIHSRPLSSLSSPRHTGGSTSRKILRFVDKIAKSKYFQKATENEYIKKKIAEVSNMPLMLSVEVLELSGTLAINIPPPPTDRIWYWVSVFSYRKLKGVFHCHSVFISRSVPSGTVFGCLPG